MEVARLVPVRHDKHDHHDHYDKRDSHDSHDNSVARAARPHEIPPARQPAARQPAAPQGRPVRVRHAARHARSSDLRPRRRASLAIRSAERRRWAADLTGPGSGGLVVYGMGGIGKSTLAAQIAARVSRLQSGRVVSVINGEVSAAGFAAGPAEADFIICDNFDDNLSLQAGRWTIADPDLAALLAGWTGKLLITCRRPFTLDTGQPGQPGQPGQARLAFRRLGPLTRSGAAELTTSLPAVRLLGEAERDQAWRLTAGHPLALEYLDLLLARGERYQDLAGRLETAIEAATGQPLPRTEPTELPEATAELIACAAGGVMFGELFDRLSAGARSLLVRTSVFRGPVPAGALGPRPGHIAECEAAGLLTIEAGRELAVHRWTGDELHRRLAAADLGGQVAAAHQQAAGYWLSRTAGPGQHADLEAGYHQRRAADLARVPGPPAARRSRRTRNAVAGAVAAVSAVLAVEAGHALPHLASAESSAGAPGRAASTVTGAIAARDQAAAWLAREASTAAIIACDPAMCAALAQHGVAAGSLLPLGRGAGDPLGSDLVVATAAVRGRFGARLASVYAPEVAASFGTGAARIDVRIVAPDGTARYRAALAADVSARQAAGLQLLRDPTITVTPQARAALAAGQVDARLLITLAVLAASRPVRIAGFADRGPGASPGLPLRTVQITAPPAAGRAMLAFVRAQRSPYLAAHAGLTHGETVLTVEFAAPGPLGLLRT